MRACGNDVPRAFVLFLFPVSEGSAPDSLFLGGVHRSPLLEYPPTCSSPGNFGGVFATSALGFFSRGGIFGSRPLDRKTWTQKIYPDFGVAYYDRATPVITEGNERAIERATDRAPPNVRSGRPTATPRRRAIGPGAKGETSGVRACGGVAARDARASSAFS